MVGTPGHSGGRREGAGKKPASFRLKIGDVVSIRELFPDGLLPLRTGEVTGITRTKLTIKLDDRELIFTR